jgi:hypothetical protein
MDFKFGEEVELWLNNERFDPLQHCYYLGENSRVYFVTFSSEAFADTKDTCTSGYEKNKYTLKPLSPPEPKGERYEVYEGLFDGFPALMIKRKFCSFFANGDKEQFMTINYATCLPDFDRWETEYGKSDRICTDDIASYLAADKNHKVYAIFRSAK